MASAGAPGKGQSGQTAAAVIIGDEILSGRTRDANAGTLAKFLDERGLVLREVRFVPDETPRIVEAVNALRREHDHVFTSGGIGPTHDDITADAISEVFGARVDVRDDARAILEAHYPQGSLNEARLRMARIPDGAELVENPVSAAPGFHLGNVWVLAGVPAVFNAMLDSIGPKLAGGPPLVSASVSAAVPEGAHADALRQLAEADPELKIGSYPFARGGRVGTTVVIRGLDGERVAACAHAVRQLFADLGADSIDVS